MGMAGCLRGLTQIRDAQIAISYAKSDFLKGLTSRWRALIDLLLEWKTFHKNGIVIHE